ncbi:MAG: FlgD immunoglobulin-like domain containing protein [Candidatus Eisenbacteria bacterium]
MITGWPKELGDQCHVAPAMGDLDDDGRAEIVFLTNSALVVVDVNQQATPPSASWPMYGHDPARTGCANCPDPAPSDVAEGVSDLPTSVLLAAPEPNPATGPVTLAFTLPDRARVALEVFDVQGRRVATPLRAEVEAGEHSALWNGRDASGRPVADGRYYVRLRAHGPGGDEESVRAVTILR